MFKSKNPYKPFLCLEGLPCEEIGKAYEEGQQNPDPKQYAKREELEKEIEKIPNYVFADIPPEHKDDDDITRWMEKENILNAIRTLGIEKEV